MRYSVRYIAANKFYKNGKAKKERVEFGTPAAMYLEILKRRSELKV